MTKKAAATSTSSPTAPLSGRRSAVHYLIVIVGLIVAIDALVGDKGLMAMLKARQDYRGLEISLARARAENARMRDQARRLREDPATIEGIARRELGLIQPGEKLFLLRDVPSAGAPPRE